METILAQKQAPRPMQTTFKAPGKLFLMGEYAILNPGHSALLMAVDRYVHCQVDDQDPDQPSQCHSDWPGMDVLWVKKSTSAKLEFKSQNLKAWSYVIEAIKLIADLAEIQQLPWRSFNLQIQSDLHNQAGRKYGLGSSAAVTVAVIGALLKFQGLQFNYPALARFKLATLVSIQAGSNGSMADIATSSFGGLIYYQRYDADWLDQQLAAGKSLTYLLSEDWPALQIKKLALPSPVQYQIAWTGQPASTQNLVADLKEKLVSQPEPFLRLSQEIHVLVQKAKVALADEATTDFLTLIQANQKVLTQLAISYQLPIISPQLADFLGACYQAGWVGKISGAGGGDCGLAFSQTGQSTERLHQAWQELGIETLNFKLAPSISR
ncbi:phosphomevalonate kinase [Ignavigranum ruoffiae]|uniref:phosphomevalonate kinase n=1 Tax=Ignavigranum ruoffiae TaxID=89093 RepID=UPI002054D626|nr:phosphomevalonate kinase [Ignavigranum ruoffiae]UPQ86059.1 phosphomevalonate kinase [Ignavigranum ruoffiae]